MVVATTRHCSLVTKIVWHEPRRGPRSPSGWCTRVRVGTWSPGTWIEQTFEPSEWTASPPRQGPVVVSSRVKFQGGIWLGSSPAAPARGIVRTRPQSSFRPPSSSFRNVSLRTWGGCCGSITSERGSSSAVTRSPGWVSQSRWLASISRWKARQSSSPTWRSSPHVTAGQRCQSRDRRTAGERPNLADSRAEITLCHTRPRDGLRAAR